MATEAARWMPPEDALAMIGAWPATPLPEGLIATVMGRPDVVLTPEVLIAWASSPNAAVLDILPGLKAEDSQV
jgi:hypothetical protein